MSGDRTVSELLLLWEEAHHRGRPVTPEELCRDCPERLAELRRQVAALAAVNALMDTSPDDAAATADGRLPPAAGRYRPVRAHAAGGLGEVLLAEDAELNRPVALKRLQDHRADDPESRRRFLREAEITAKLQHPGIVPVYGLTHDTAGRPAYAMRFIDGEPLSEAVCRFHAAGARFDSLEFRQLLQHFVAACNAVAYAHSRGVVHRDLKPANVMLGRFGEALVVDWGLAKAIDAGEGSPDPESDTADLRPQTPDLTDATDPGQILGTPAYMPPEQADGRADDLGPAADVFGLGATLFTLLTGGPPYAGRHYGAVLNLARRCEFPRPRTVNPNVPRPLEAVCLKAMAADPGGRYATATALAADVERWLADRPVAADREPWRERARRWAKRHRTLTTAAAVGLVVGALTLSVAAVLLAKARTDAERQRDIARLQRQRTREALDDMTSEEAGDWLATRPAVSPRQRAFLEKSLAYYREFAAETASDRDGQELVAKAQRRVGSLLDDLGRLTEAEQPLRAAAEAFAGLAAADPGAPADRRDQAGCRVRLGRLLLALGRPAEAEAEYRTAMALLEPLAAADPVARHGLAASQNNLGILLAERGQWPEAEALYGAALGLRERLAADAPTEPLHRRELAFIHTNLGVLYQQTRPPADAERAYLTAQKLQARLAAEFPAVPAYRHELAGTTFNLGGLYNGQERPADAEAAYRAALVMYARLAAEAPAVPKYRHDLATTHNNLGILLRDAGKSAEAVAEYRKAAPLWEALVSECPAVPIYRIELGRLYHNLGNVTYHTDAAAARAWHDRALGLLLPLHAQPVHAAEVRGDVVNCYRGRAEAEEKLRRVSEALADWKRAWDLADEATRIDITLDRAECLADTGKPQQALAAVVALAGADAPAKRLYRVARVHALAAGSRPPLSAAEADRAAARAVELLHRAVEAGYRETADWPRDADLAALRRLADFAALLWDVADLPPPGRPP
jgi:serine/threonine-protein kinase